GPGGREADEAAEQIDAGPAGEAGIEREIDGEHLTGLAPTAAANVERADDAGAGAGTRAERQNQMADAKLAVVMDVGGGHADDLGAKHGDVQPGVATGDLRGERSAVRGGERHLAIGLDGVARSHDEPSAPVDPRRRQAPT